LRCRNHRRHPGGGGINVARVLKRLGCEAVAVFPAAGVTGQMLADQLSAEGVASIVVHTDGTTRENVTVDEEATGRQYRFVFPGPDASPKDTQACLDQAVEHLPSGGWLVASGSLAPGMPDDTYERLGASVRARQGRLVLDAAGLPMRKALPHTFLLKLSEQELEQAVGAPVFDRGRCVAGARLLLHSGPQLIAVTRGESGALLVSRDFALTASAPPIVPKSTVGAGDSFLAALTWSLANRKMAADALGLAVAAGTAALLEPGTELASATEISRLAPMVTVESLHETAIC
jgi:6-phosphofructokinase 2